MLLATICSHSPETKITFCTVQKRKLRSSAGRLHIFIEALVIGVFFFFFFFLFFFFGRNEKERSATPFDSIDKIDKNAMVSKLSFDIWSSMIVCVCVIFHCAGLLNASRQLKGFVLKKTFPDKYAGLRGVVAKKITD